MGELEISALIFKYNVNIILSRKIIIMKSILFKYGDFNDNDKI